MTIATFLTAPICAGRPGWGRSSVIDLPIGGVGGQFRGRGRIVGTTKIKGTPDFPSGARLILIHERTTRVVGSVYSDPSTGAYVFDAYDHAESFTVLAYDLSGIFRAAVANGVYPVLS